MQQQRVIHRATIDVRQLLRHAVAAYGYDVGEERDGFVKLTKPDLPKGVAVFFAANRGPLYGILPIANAQLTVIVHVCDDVDDSEYNALAHPLGAHVQRLRDLGALDMAELETLRSTVVALRSTVSPSETPTDEEAPPGLDLTKVAEYAKTQEDTLFEWATAKIIGPLVSRTFRFGNAFRGSPVPDGLLIESDEALLYDCKSKKGDDYPLAPKDGDQQNRYTPILQRLQTAAHPITGKAVVLFTPEVDEETFNAQTQKEFWSKIVADGFQLIVVPAKCLLALHSLNEGEDSASAFFDRRAFWKAFVDQELVGVVDDPMLTRLLGDRAKRKRLVSVEHVEMAWLAAVIRRPREVSSVAEAISDVDPGSSIGEKVARPAVLRKFFQVVRGKSPTLASIAKATGLTERAVEYLLVAEPLTKNLTLDELGDEGPKNLRLLRESLKTT